MIRKLKSGEYRLYSQKGTERPAGVEILERSPRVRRRRSTSAPCSSSSTVVAASTSAALQNPISVALSGRRRGCRAAGSPASCPFRRRLRHLPVHFHRRTHHAVRLRKAVAQRFARLSRGLLRGSAFPCPGGCTGAHRTVPCVGTGCGFRRRRLRRCARGREQKTCDRDVRSHEEKTNGARSGSPDSVSACGSGSAKMPERRHWMRSTIVTPP